MILDAVRVEYSPACTGLAPGCCPGAALTCLYRPCVWMLSGWSTHLLVLALRLDAVRVEYSPACVTVAWVVARSKTGVSVLMSTNEIFVQDLRWLPIHDGLHLHKSVYV